MFFITKTTVISMCNNNYATLNSFCYVYFIAYCYHFHMLRHDCILNNTQNLANLRLSLFSQNFQQFKRLKDLHLKFNLKICVNSNLIPVSYTNMTHYLIYFGKPKILCNLKDMMNDMFDGSQNI